MLSHAMKKIGNGWGISAYTKQTTENVTVTNPLTAERGNCNSPTRTGPSALTAYSGSMAAAIAAAVTPRGTRSPRSSWPISPAC